MRRWSCPWVLAGGLATALAGVALAAAPPQAAAPSRYHEKLAGTAVSFEMIPVPAGDGLPAFFIGRTEVTWDMYDVFALGLDQAAPTTPGADAVARPSNPYGAPDHGWGHAGFPAMSVTRAAAEAFCQWLSAKTGKTYRLPTDAEWSRAASLATAGKNTGASLDAIAWHRGNADGRTHAVGTRASDALGLVDLFGNTAEWVTMADGALVTRGGSYRDAGDGVGPAARATQDPSWNDTDPQLPKSRWWLSDGPFVGFRLAAPIPPGSPDTGAER